MTVNERQEKKTDKKARKTAVPATPPGAFGLYFLV